MKNGDLITTLTLDNKDFKNGVNEAVSQMQKFKEQADKTTRELDDLSKNGNVLQQGMLGLGKSLGIADGKLLKMGKTLGKFTKFLGPIGLAITVLTAAYETMTKAVSSNNETQIKFSSTMDGLTGVVDKFFNALSSDDWSVFDKGITNAIKKGKNYARVMRELKMSLDIDKSRAERLEENARLNNSKIDNATTAEEVDDALNKLVSGLQDANNDRKSSNDSYLNNFSAAKGEYGLTDNVTNEDVDQMMQYVWSSSTTLHKTTDDWANIAKNYDEAQKYLKQADNSNGKLKIDDDLRKKYNDDINEYNRRINATLADPSYTLRDTKLTPREFLDNAYRLRDIPVGEKRDDFKEAVDAVTENIARIGTNNDEIFSAKEHAKSKKEELRKAEEERRAEILANAPKATPEPTIDTQAIKFDSFQMPVVLQKDSLQSLSQEKAVLTKKLNETTNSKEAVELQVKIAKLDKKEKDFKSGDYIQIDQSEFDGSSLKLDTSEAVAGLENLSEKLAEEKEKERELFDQMNNKAGEAAGALGNVGNMFSALGGAVGGTAGEMLSFFGTAAQGIADLIPQIMKLVTAKQAEAIASGTAEGAKAPWFANLGIIAGIVATIIGIFSSLPKFAQGGVISGPKTMGDFNLARVNGGEMILNSSQQGRLFNMLNGAGAIGNRTVPVEREWKIKGSTLVGAIKNEMALEAKVGRKIF